MSYVDHSLCGCFYLPSNLGPFPSQRDYLPQVGLSSRTSILSASSRTALRQTFLNPSSSTQLPEVHYSFPLYDGVSVVGFRCTIGDRIIYGQVKEKQQARRDYREAVDRGETAGLLEQYPDAADCFTTRIGNVAAGQSVVVEITYLGELKTDAETDGLRFTIPTVIAPRYGLPSGDSSRSLEHSAAAKGNDGIHILVDIAVESGISLRGVQSPSHPIAISMGRTSSMSEDSFDNRHASATLTLGKTELDNDFVIVVTSKGHATPRALLEHHPTISNHRALMATLVPKFNLPPVHPEIVFVADRSGSMGGKIPTLISALKVFLKSLPVGTKFNVYSFGIRHESLWPRSKTYDESSLNAALTYVDSFAANFGGTNILPPIKDVFNNRYTDMHLEVIVVTDGQIRDQQRLFDFINEVTANSVRFFSLGIGSGASSSLVEGIARAGNGFAQFVNSDEKMDKRVVRMLKGSLTPHVKDYAIEVEYDKADEEYEIIESVTESLRVLRTNCDTSAPEAKKTTISLFDESMSKDDTHDDSSGKYDHLPHLDTPKLLQAPHKVPTLYSFNRVTVYLLMSAETCQNIPESVILRATSEHGPLELRIPVQDVGTDDTLHRLAARKAIHELEEGRGWITEVKSEDGQTLKSLMDGRWEEMVEREAVRLGVQFQVAGKWCAFVATGNGAESSIDRPPESRIPSHQLFGAPSFHQQLERASGMPQLAQHMQSAPSSAGLADGPRRNHTMSGERPQPRMRREHPQPRSANLGGGPIRRQMMSMASPGPSEARTSATSNGQASGFSGGQFGTLGSSSHSAKDSKDQSGKILYCRRTTDTDQGPISGVSTTNARAATSLHTDRTGGPSTSGLMATQLPQTVEEMMHELVLLQKFDGSWEWTARLVSVLKLQEQVVMNLLIGLDKSLVATLVALAFLQGNPEVDKEVCEMVVDKARNWAVVTVGDDDRVAEALAKIKTDVFGLHG